jgi:transmembrane sensor
MNLDAFRKKSKKRCYEEASYWVMENDGGLSPSQQDAFHQWLAADPRNRKAYAENSGVWNELDRIAGLNESESLRYDHDILKPKSSKRVWRMPSLGLVGVGIAAGFLLTFTRVPQEIQEMPVQLDALVEFPKRIQKGELEDGSTYELKRGSEIEVLYAKQERRIRLVRGEATFTVQKDPSRPFRVQVGSLQVEALGTIFNVRDGMQKIDVLVTEGRVKLSSENEPAEAVFEDSGEAETIVESMQQASILRSGERMSIQVLAVDEKSVEKALLWRPVRLEFVETPLAEIVGEFNRRNELQIVLSCDKLSALKITSFFWSDDVEAFVHLMKHGLGMTVTWTGKQQIMLSPPP